MSYFYTKFAWLLGGFSPPIFQDCFAEDNGAQVNVIDCCVLFVVFAVNCIGVDVRNIGAPVTVPYIMSFTSRLLPSLFCIVVEAPIIVAVDIAHAVLGVESI